LRNVSVSGAFIKTDLELPLFGLVDVEVQVVDAEIRSGRTLQTHVIAACVVRSDRSGIGVEWIELAPSAVIILVAGRVPSGTRHDGGRPRSRERRVPLPRSVSRRARKPLDAPTIGVLET
jgi:hypothetical protein